MQSPRSVLLITVDCFRADHAGFLGYPRATTPFLNSLAEESIVFSNAIVAGAPTYFSFPAIMASRYPLGLGRDVAGLAPQELTIASALSESGYSTAAFLAANPYLSPQFGYDAGFGVFKDFLDTGSSPVMSGPDGGNGRFARRWNRRLAKASHALGPVGSIYDELYFQYCQRMGSPPVSSFDQMRRFPSADVIVDHARDWLSGIAGQPFFLWLHLMDPHSPYYPKQEALDLMEKTSIDASRARYLNSYWNRADINWTRLRQYREAIVSLYDAGIRWVDAQVARLVATLQELGLWQDCIMALTADHGEEFLDHGGRYHPPLRMSEELVRVPLLLRGSGLARPGTAAAPFSLLHLAPTLLDVANVPIPGSFQGRSHAALLKGGGSWKSDAIVECVAGCTNPFMAENRLHSRVLVVREARYKMVLDFKESSVEHLFDLEADPGELRPLPPEAEKPVRRRLLERARQHLSDSLRSRNEDLRSSAQLRDLRLEWTSPVVTSV